ncbi:MAG: hypothetical protein WBR15_03850 [Gammaproteobacteria bacterium]
MEQRSEFVTVLAWIFIVLSGLGLLILGLDTVVFWVFPFDKLIAQSAALSPNQPRISTALMAALFRWVFVVILLIQAWMFASSIGLLLRKNWARLSFIVIMVIGLIWNGLYLIFGILGMVGIHFFLNTAMTPPGMPPGFQSFIQVFMVGFVIVNIAFLVLFGWILKKLVSENIRQEFVKPADTSTTLTA